MASEKEEREKVKALEASFAKLCEATDRVVSSDGAANTTAWDAVLRELEEIFDNQMAKVLQEMLSEELEQLKQRGERQLKAARVLEHIAVAVCVAVLVIVILGVVLIRRSLQVLVRKEGAEAANRAKSEFLANYEP